MTVLFEVDNLDLGYWPHLLERLRMFAFRRRPVTEAEQITLLQRPSTVNLIAMSVVCACIRLYVGCMCGFVILRPVFHL